VRPRTIRIPAASGQLTNEAGCIGYFAVAESTGGASAEFNLWDGSSAAGYNLLPITLNAGESTSDRIGWHFQRFETGLYFDLESGSVEGSISVLLNHLCEDHLHPQLVVNIPIDELARYAQLAGGG
jgi:hypothetical protein